MLILSFKGVRGWNFKTKLFSYPWRIFCFTKKGPCQMNYCSMPHFIRVLTICHYSTSLLGLSRYAISISRYIAICGKHIAIISQYIVPKCQDAFWVKMKRILTRDWIFKSRVFTICTQQDSEAQNHYNIAFNCKILWSYWSVLNEIITASSNCQLSNEITLNLFWYNYLEALVKGVMVGLTWASTAFVLISWVTIWLVGAADWDANSNLLFCQINF